MKNRKLKSGFVKRGQCLFLLSFIGLIVTGTLLLKIPGMYERAPGAPDVELKTGRGPAGGAGVRPEGKMKSDPKREAGGRLKWVDALFVATSAVCVTGLSPVEMTDFNFFGKLVVLVLIQLGGFGIMTLSAAILLAIGRGLSFSDALMVSNLNESFSLRGTESLLRMVVTYTIVAEAAGALLMLPGMVVFEYGELQQLPASDSTILEALRLTVGSFARGFGDAVFLSVSSFCNAGFSPVADNLAKVGRWVQFVSLLLMITGGIGIYVVYDLRQRISLLRNFLPDGVRRRVLIALVMVVLGVIGQLFFSRSNLIALLVSLGLLIGIAAGIYFVCRRSPLYIHTKLVLLTTAVLLILGAAGVWSLCTAATRPIDWFDALFFSATARTCGFYTVPLVNLPQSAQSLLIFLMLIGGSPGGTAGGIKTSTVALVFVAILSVLRGDTEVMLFNRRIPTMNVLRAFTIILIFALLGYSGAVFMQTLKLGLPSSDVNFEAISALTTTGLSIGATTAGLSAAGKLLLVVFMFLGRVGPFTALLFLLGRERHAPIQYPEERIIIG